MPSLVGCDGQNLSFCGNCIRKRVDSKTKIEFVKYVPDEKSGCVFAILPAFYVVCEEQGINARITSNNTVKV